MKTKNSKDFLDEVERYNKIHNTHITVEKVEDYKLNDRVYRTTDERYLFELMIDFEDEYFEDLSLKMYEKTPIGKVQNIDGTYDYYGSYELNPYADIMKIRIEEPNENNDYAAQCDSLNKTITFFRGRYEKSKKLTLLHEMIHSYDYTLINNPRKLRDLVLLNLYNKILKFISKKNLFEILWNENHQVFQIGLGHNTLFVLKSLDLDIRLNKKLGTILSYGRKAWYGKIPYKKYK